MISARARGQLLGGSSVIPGYALLYVAWISSREFAHTYEHWLEGLDRSLLPDLTYHVLPLIGVDAGPAMASAPAFLAWLVAACWPAGSLVIFLRSSEATRFAVLALHLHMWLGAFLAAAGLGAVGLWLPFSLL